MAVTNKKHGINNKCDNNVNLQKKCLIKNNKLFVFLFVRSVVQRARYILNYLNVLLVHPSPPSCLHNKMVDRVWITAQHKMHDEHKLHILGKQHSSWKIKRNLPKVGKNVFISNFPKAGLT